MDMYAVNSIVIAGTERSLKHILAEDGIPAQSPDVFIREYRQFGIDEARDIIDRASTRAITGSRRYFLLVVPSMTIEAQNALLKTIEEPKADAVFYFLTPSPHALLPTIRSRSVIRRVTTETEDTAFDIDAFLKGDVGERITLLKELHEHEDEGRDMAAILSFLQSLERRLAPYATNPRYRTGIDSVYRARNYVTDKGSLLKALLEQVALAVPKM